MENQNKKIEGLKEELNRLKAENESIKKVLNSKRFRVAEKMANVYNGIFPVGTLRRKMVKTLYIPVQKSLDIYRKRTIKKIERSIEKYDYVIVMHSIPWNTPLKQRPHHLARCLAADRKNVFVIYLEPDEQINRFRKISENFITTNSWDVILGLAHKQTKKYYFFFNNVSNIAVDLIKKISSAKYEIVYEYIDEFHEDISGSLTNQLETWKYLGKNNPRLVLASAKKLYDEAVKHFEPTKVILSKNAVNVEDFDYHGFLNSEVPKDIEKIIKQKKPIVGYYGALAPWLDYDLISKTAKNNPDLNFVLIGVNYQNALNLLDQSIKNIYYLGPKKYNELPLYSSHFDCAIIPFETGQIAKGTSPVKLFEYMAMGIPTVGTKDLKECEGYEHVYLAKNSRDFSDLLTRAIAEHKDEKNREKLLREAKKNSWQSRAHDIYMALEG